MHFERLDGRENEAKLICNRKFQQKTLTRNQCKNSRKLALSSLRESQRFCEVNSRAEKKSFKKKAFALHFCCFARWKTFLWNEKLSRNCCSRLQVNFQKISVNLRLQQQWEANKLHHVYRLHVNLFVLGILRFKLQSVDLSVCMRNIWFLSIEPVKLTSQRKKNTNSVYASVTFLRMRRARLSSVQERHCIFRHAARSRVAQHEVFFPFPNTFPVYNQQPSLLRSLVCEKRSAEKQWKRLLRVSREDFCEPIKRQFSQ